MSTEENKALIRTWVEEVLNTGDVSDQSPAYRLIAPNFVGHFPGQPPISGLEALRQFGAAYFTAFPDLRITPEELIAEGEKVIMRYDWRGTHQREFMGIPATGKQVRVSGISILRIAGGKIVEQWDNFDTLGMLQQLGAVPAPAMSQAGEPQELSDEDLEQVVGGDSSPQRWQILQDTQTKLFEIQQAVT